MRLGVLSIFILVCFSNCSVAQVADSCYQKTQSKSDFKRLESIMCIPKGYHIVDIYEKDLNKDGRIDKVTEWFKEELSNGDTTFHSIYFQNQDGTFRHFITYNNLSSLHFDLESQSRDVNLEDSLLNEIKHRYMYYDDLPEFTDNGILISFYVDAVEKKKLFYVYSEARNDFILRKEESWLAPVTDQYDRELLNEATYSEQEGMLLTNFRMLEYLE